MSAGIDVLAVIRAERDKAGASNARGERYKALRATHDAVAELIAAAEEAAFESALFGYKYDRLCAALAKVQP